MAEIKSAIELAMERTKNLVMDDREKEESQKKETENKVKAILRRYLEGIIGAESAMREIDEVKADPGLKRRLLMSLVLDEFDITAVNPRLIDVLKYAGRGLPGSFMAELDGILGAFDREMEAKEGVVREKVSERLKGMGIYGDGLEPNVEAWEEWADTREATGRIFKEQIGEWKERLVTALEKG